MPELMPWHKNWLKNIEYDRVDLVKEGANSQAHIKLFKSRGGEVMNFEDIMKSLKPEHAQIVSDVIKSKEDEVSKAEVAKKAAEDALEELKKNAPQPTANQSEEEILKSVKDPAVRSLLEAQISKTKAAEAQVKKALDEKLSNEAISKAKEVPNLGAEEQTLADVYKKLKNVDAELCDNVFGIFKAASALVNEGGALSEIGKSAGTDTVATGSEEEAWDKIEKKAEEIAKARDIKKNAAISVAISEHPELYNAYLKAQQG